MLLQEPESKSNHNRPILASHALVQNATTAINGTPDTATTTKTHMLSSAERNTRTMPKPKMEAIRLEDQWRESLLKNNWSENCANRFSNFIAESTLRQYNNYIAKFQNFCASNNFSFPPCETQRSAIIAEFLLFKAKQSQRPESMLRSVRAALTHYFNVIGTPEPFCKLLRNINTALVKTETNKPTGRTPIMPLKPFIDMFLGWPENDKLSMGDLR